MFHHGLSWHELTLPALSGSGFQPTAYCTTIMIMTIITMIMIKYTNTNTNTNTNLGWVSDSPLSEYLIFGKKRADQSGQSGWSKLIELETNKLKDNIEQRNRPTENTNIFISSSSTVLELFRYMFSSECSSAVSLFNAVTSEIDIPFDLYDRGLILRVYDHIATNPPKIFPPNAILPKHFPCFSIFYWRLVIRDILQ